MIRVIGENLTLFTPTIVSSGGGEPTYANQVGRIIAVGNLRFITVNVTLATLGTLAAGNITIEGNPFTNSAMVGAALTIRGVGLGASATPSLQSVMPVSSSVITPYIFSAGDLTQMTVAMLNGTSQLQFSGHFEI